MDYEEKEKRALANWEEKSEKKILEPDTFVILRLSEKMVLQLGMDENRKIVISYWYWPNGTESEEVHGVSPVKPETPEDIEEIFRTMIERTCQPN